MPNMKDSKITFLKKILPVLNIKGSFISGLSSEPSAQLTSDMLLFVRGLGEDDPASRTQCNCVELFRDVSLRISLC